MGLFSIDKNILAKANHRLQLASSVVHLTKFFHCNRSDGCLFLTTKTQSQVLLTCGYLWWKQGASHWQHFKNSLCLRALVVKMEHPLNGYLSLRY